MTQQNETITEKRIELSNISISEFNREGNPVATIGLSVPYRFDLYRFRPLEEYERIALEDLRLKSSTAFELIDFLAAAIRDGEYNPLALAEYIILLCRLGQGFSEAADLVQMSFEKYREHTEIQEKGGAK